MRNHHNIAKIRTRHHSTAVKSHLHHSKFAGEPVANGHGGKGDEDGGHPEDEHRHEEDRVLLLLVYVDRLCGCGNVSRVYRVTNQVVP